MSPYLAEFLGTMLLIVMGNGVVANVLLKDTKGESAGLLPICLAWGLAVTLAIFAVGRISEAHLNPAITIALAVSGSFDSGKVIGYLTAQFAGAFLGAVLVWIFYHPHFARTTNQGLKLAVFCTGPAIRSTGSNLFSEVFATMILV